MKFSILFYILAIHLSLSSLSFCDLVSRNERRANNRPTGHPTYSAWLPQVERAATDPTEATIAYFIQISDATLTLLPRLLRTLWHRHNTYVIHFDKKIPVWQRKHAEATVFKGNTHYKDNVHVMESEVITYRGISMVLNILNAMETALDRNADWDYWINISGSDYPLVSPENQRKLLATNDFLQRQRSFFSFSEPEWWAESKVFRYDRLFTDTSVSFNESETQVVDSYTDQPISQVANFTFVAAEAWMILHRTYVTKLLRSSFARRMLMAFAYSLEPEEHYFAAVAWNDPQFNATNVPHALRHVAWVHNGVHSGQHPYYIDQQEPDGKTWSFREEIENSACMFTRKIRIQDSGLLTYIDTHVSGVAESAVQKDVDNYLGKVSAMVDCIGRLTSGDRSAVCWDPTHGR